jgi:tetratricopeptide (TPR) repeat protein
MIWERGQLVALAAAKRALSMPVLPAMTRMLAIGCLNLALIVAGSISDAGPSHAQEQPATVETSLYKLNRAAAIYIKHSRPDDAAFLAEQAVAMAEKFLGENDARTATSLANLGEARAGAGKTDEAVRLLRRALAIRERVLPENHPDIATSLSSLAWVLTYTSQTQEVEPLYRKALAIREKILSPDHPDIVSSLNRLAGALAVQKRPAEAEQLYRRVVHLRERDLPEYLPDLSYGLTNLAATLATMGRYSEAEPLYRRALDLQQKIFPYENIHIAITLSNLGATLIDLKQFDEAEQVLRRSLAIREKLSGPDSLDVAMALNVLASGLGEQGRLDEAEQMYRRELAIREKTLPKDHPDLAFALNNLGRLLEDAGRYMEADPLLQRALAVRKNGLAASHTLIADSLGVLAELRGRYQGRHREALSLLEEGSGIFKAPENRALAAQAPWRVWSKLRVDYSDALVKSEGAQAADLVEATRRDVFLDLQRERAGGTGGAIAAAMARVQTDTEVARLARKRDDALSEIKQLDNAFLAASSQTGVKKDERSRQLTRLRDETDAYRSEVAKLDDEIARRFPAYAELAEAKPLSVSDLQNLLADDEVLVTVTPHDKGGFLFAYSRDKGIFASLPEAGPVADMARRLRCSAAAKLDPACRDAMVLGEAKPVAEAGSTALSRSVRLFRQDIADNETFDLDLAHQLYNQLFPAEVRGFLDGKKLIVVPAPELMGMPWHLLVTEPPPRGWNAGDAGRTKAYREAKWLFQTHPAITILPTVASLRALRSVSHGVTGADRSFLGLGDPVIGTSAEQRNAPAMDCGRLNPIQVADLESGDKTARSPASQPSALFAGARDDKGFTLADPELVRSQPRLADTRCELIAVAKAMQADQGGETDILLGEDATEARLRQLNANGDLARYRVLHFATHGLLGGELGLGEPGLVLTPPETASASDDGILTASEIATLNLSADWVVLSACNTAAGSAADAEALSGMARSFFYAGARSLLVSSWPVYSSAACAAASRAIGTRKGEQDT